MTKLALNSKGVGAATTRDDSAPRNTQGGEGEGIVVLSDIASKFLGGRALSRKEVAKRVRRWIEGRKVDTPRIAAGSEEYVGLC